MEFAAALLLEFDVAESAGAERGNRAELESHVFFRRVEEVRGGRRLQRGRDVQRPADVGAVERGEVFLPDHDRGLTVRTRRREFAFQPFELSAFDTRVLVERDHAHRQRSVCAVGEGFRDERVVVGVVRPARDALAEWIAGVDGGVEGGLAARTVEIRLRGHGERAVPRLAEQFRVARELFCVVDRHRRRSRRRPARHTGTGEEEVAHARYPRRLPECVLEPDVGA